MSWLEDLLGYKDVRNALGALMPRRKQLRFIDGGVTDNPTLGTTDITFGATSLHSAQTMADGLHGAVCASFASAALRRAFPAIASDVGRFAFQTDTTPLTLWYIDSVSGGVATWRQVTTSSDSGAVTPLTIITSVPVRLWLRADLGVTIATGVSSWVDQTGNAYAFNQATGSLQPARNAADSTLNNQASITGDGTDDTLFNSTINITASFWSATVAKVNTWTLNHWLWAGAGGFGHGVLQAGSSPALYLIENASQLPHAGAAIGAWKCFIEQEQNTTADKLVIGSVVATGTAMGRTTSINSMNLFSGSGGGSNGGVSIAEKIVTDGIPTPTEQANIQAYLTARYFASLFT